MDGLYEGMLVNEGDEIYFGIYAGIDLGDDLIMIKYEDIMGVIEPIKE